MSISIRLFTLLIVLFASFSSWAQKSYQYQLDGTYVATLPGLSEPRAIKFSLHWNEKKNVIEGVYADTFFTSGSPVSGITNIAGRTFNISLPRMVATVITLSISTNDVAMTGGTVPLNVYMKDNVAQNVDQSNISANIFIRPEEPTSTCESGFGPLAGYCGLYQGRIVETADSDNRCNLPDYQFRLELSDDAKMNLFFYYSNTTVGIPAHNLGGFEEPPTSTAINQTERHCGTLMGTDFSKTNCQKLLLSGSFSELAGTKRFEGTYYIRDEVTNESCAYNLSLERAN